MRRIQLFEDFISEAAVLRDLETKYSITLDLYDNGKWLDLSRIEVPKEQRGSGIGSMVMQEICDYADQQGKKIYLTPSKDFGASSVSRLEKFYKEFSFVKKPKDDFAVRHTMVRMPEGQTFESLLEKGKKPQSIAQKFKALGKKLKKISDKGEDAVDKVKDLQQKQKEGDAEPSDKLTANLLKTQASIAQTDATKVQLTRQQLALKQKIKTAKESEKAKKEMERKTKEIQKEGLMIEGKPKGAPDFHHSDAPDANGRFRDLSIKDLAAWLIKTRDGDVPKITGSLNQQIVFNKNDDPDYADKMEKTRKEIYKQLGRTDLLKEANETEATYNDYPAAAKNNAQQAIDWKEKHGRDEVTGGTEVGWARAHQLAKGEKLSKDVVSRMAQFNRHRKNSGVSAEFKDEPWKDRGNIAWLIWGGTEGVDWAIKKMEEIEKAEVKEAIVTLKHVKLFEQFVNNTDI